MITAYQQNRISKNSNILIIATVASAFRLVTTILFCCYNFLLIPERKDIEVFIVNLAVVHLLCTFYDAICLASSLKHK
jgi:hypothetical protein